MTKKTVLLATAAILALIVGVVLFLELTNRTYLFHSKPSETIQEAKQNIDKKKALAESPASTPTPTSTPTSDGKPTPAQQYSAPSGSDNIALTLSQPNATDVVVSTKLNGYSDGTCKLTASNAGKTTTQSAPVYYERAFSTCAGFTIPVSSIGTGTWSISLDVISGGVTSTQVTAFEVK